jgi:Domain of unknown function (DUF4386)
MTTNAEASPGLIARAAGVFYLITFAAGISALFVRGTPGLVAGLVAAACYVAVTLLFYALFKPVNRGLALVAALVSLAGCAIGPLSQFHLVPFHINPLVFFGVYCLLIGSLILGSTFLPRVLGVLMAVSGLGWLTFLSPPLANHLSPFIYFPGILGEGALTVWLLVGGVNTQKWKEQAVAAEASIGACGESSRVAGGGRSHRTMLDAPEDRGTQSR